MDALVARLTIYCLKELTEAQIAFTAQDEVERFGLTLVHNFFVHEGCVVSPQDGLDVFVQVFGKGSNASGGVELEAHCAEADKVRFVIIEQTLYGLFQSVPHQDEIGHVYLMALC